MSFLCRSRVGVVGFVIRPKMENLKPRWVGDSVTLTYHHIVVSYAPFSFSELHDRPIGVRLVK